MKKKVLILFPSLTRGGGAEQVASTLSVNLSKNYDISILTFFHPPEIYPFKGKYYSIQEKHYMRSVISRFYKIQKIIKSISPDIIITCMNKASFWIIPLKYLFKIEAPLIILMNTNPNLHYRKKFYFKFLLRFLYPLKKVNAIVTISNGLKAILTKKFKIEKAKIITIYNGVDITKIKQKTKEKVDEYEGMFQDSRYLKFITAGRLSGEKGHKYLIDAFCKVGKAIPNSKLFILGEGPLRIQLEKQIRKNELNKDVFLLGFKKNPYKYMSNANIFVLPSLHEGLSLVLIEALVCNLPVISTDCEVGPKEILDDGKYGLLSKVADSDDLAEKMISLGKDRELREKLSRISDERIKFFEFKRFIKNWMRVIDFLTNNA